MKLTSERMVQSVSIISLGYLFCTAVHVGEGGHFADPSVLTKCIALGVVLAVFFRRQKQRASENAPPPTPLDHDTLHDQQRWCDVTMKLLSGSRVWLLDTTWRVIASTADGECGRHVIDLVGPDKARQCLPLLSEMKRRQEIVHAHVSGGDEECRVSAIPFPADRAVLVLASRGDGR